MRTLLPIPLAAVLLALGCGGDSRPPSSSPPPSGGGQTITGREQFGWAQTAESESDLALFRYALYVDGARRVIEGATCRPAAAGGTYDCSAQLPGLSPGQHTLELATFIESDGTIVESPRSPPLQVTVQAITAPAEGPDAAQSGTLVSSDGVQVRFAVVARDLADPVDVAIAPDGRALVAERAGHVRVIDPTRPSDTATADRVLAGGEARGAMLSLAVAPDFARTGAVHVAYVVDEGGTSSLRLARFREAGGVLAQGAVTGSHAIPDHASAVMRFGPDGTLYVGVGTGSLPWSAQDLAAAGGKVLRVRSDGASPDDNPWSSPVFSVGHHQPRALVWQPQTGTLIEVEREGESDEVNAIRPGGNYGWPVARPGDRDARLSPPLFRLAAGTELSGATFVAAERSPFFGDLILSALAPEDLLRVRFDSSGRPRISGRLLQGRFGRIGQVASGPDGALYAITANTETWGRGRDLLIRVVPERSR